jgi:hypothetical protein
MWHRVEVVLTDVSEESIASIFRVEGKIRKSAREASVRNVKSKLHGATSKKTAFFIVTAVKTSNLTNPKIFSTFFSAPKALILYRTSHQ